MDIPPCWERVTFPATPGVILDVGAPDTGKTTMALDTRDGLVCPWLASAG